MATEGTGDIVVKGGSVHLSFDGTLYQKVTGGDPTVHKHEDRKITRVRVEDENGQSLFDSAINFPSEANIDGLRWKITISTQG